ncbi:MAG: hypothetical protein U0800_02495 [Isosphaeraceae bacterium]
MGRRRAPGLRRRLPAVEALEAREMLANGPASAIRPPSDPPAIYAHRGLYPTAPGGAATEASAQVAARSKSAAAPSGPAISPEARKAMYVLTAARAASPKTWDMIVRKLRTRDRPAWRALNAAMSGRDPNGWLKALPAVLARFPNAPGLPRRLAPPAAAAPAGALPSLGLPLGVNFDLTTRWRNITPTNLGGSPASVAMSSDSGVMLSLQGGNTVYFYDPQDQQQGWVTTLTQGIPGQYRILQVSAGSVLTNFAGFDVAREGWLVYQDGNGAQSAIRFAVGFNGGRYAGADIWQTQLPNGDPFAQISSGSDGAAWAVGTSGALYSYNWPNNTWTTRVSPPAPLAPYNEGNPQVQISVGSAGNAWAAVTGSNQLLGQSTAIYWWNGQSWQTVAANVRGFGSIAGVADGTLWVNYGNTLYTVPPGTTNLVPVGGPASPVGLGALAAGTRFRAVSLNGPGLGLISYGLADQPTRGYASWTAGQQAAYDSINTQLGFTWQSTDNPATRGLRTQYTNQFAVYELPLYQSSILNLAAPSNVAAADWKAVKSQVLQELAGVLGTYRMFDVLADLDQYIGTLSGDILTETGNLVQLSAGDQGSTFGIILSDVFQAGLSGIAAAVGVVSGGAGIAAAIAASGIDAALGDLTGGGSGTNFQTTYNNLQAQLTTLFQNVSEKNSQYKGAILSDPSRFLAIGAGILDGTLYWPPGSNQKLAQAAANGFQLYYLKSLMPLRWKIIAIPKFIYNSLPNYDVYVVSGSYNSSDTNQTVFHGDFRVLYDKNGDPNRGTLSGPIPTRALLNAIYAVGVAQADLFTGANGWLSISQISDF